jgi:hypothetical protein
VLKSGNVYLSDSAGRHVKWWSLDDVVESSVANEPLTAHRDNPLSDQFNIRAGKAGLSKTGQP